jgi:hypothetical protein
LLREIFSPQTHSLITFNVAAAAAAATAWVERKNIEGFKWFEIYEDFQAHSEEDDKRQRESLELENDCVVAEN